VILAGDPAPETTTPPETTETTEAPTTATEPETTEAPTTVTEPETTTAPPETAAPKEPELGENGTVGLNVAAIIVGSAKKALGD
jgi:hypothetical protein